MLKRTPKKKETKAAYMKRLRRTAMGISPDVIRKAVLNIRKRAQLIYDADGGDIARD